MRVLVIINPVSGPARRGGAAERVPIATRTFERLGAKAEIRLTERIGHAHELALEAAAAGVELVIAWGGDGTINEVGRALVQRAAEAAPDVTRDFGPGGLHVGRDDGPATPDVGRGFSRATSHVGRDFSRACSASSLGIVPGGSGNGLARELRIPFDPAQAIERALRAEVRQIDAGELGGRLFFNIAGIGFDADVAARVSTQVNHRGLLPYLRASARDLLRYRPVDYAVTVDGVTSQASALFVAVANSKQYGFGAQIAPGAKVDDGALELVVIEDRKLAGNLVRVPSLFLGRLDRQRGVRTTRVREATIHSRDAMLFHVDGEPVQGSDTLVVRVHPGALGLRA